MPFRRVRTSLFAFSATLLLAGRATALSLLLGASIPGPATIEGRTDISPGQFSFDDSYQDAQAAFVQDSATSNNGFGFVATATSSANIATGDVTSVATVTTNTTGMFARAHSQLAYVIGLNTLGIPGSSVTIDFFMDVTGSYSLSAISPLAPASIDFTATLNVRESGGQGFVNAIEQDEDVLHILASSSALSDVVDYRLVAGVEVPKAAEVVVFVVGQLRNEVHSPSATSDFGSTGSLGIFLPEGVSFTSLAGGTPTGGLEVELPAPPLAALLAGPLGALGAARGRRRATRG